MSVKITEVRNAISLNDSNTEFEVEINHPTYGWIPYHLLSDDTDTTINDDELTGIQIISRALEAPLRTIVENAGGEGSVVVAKILDGKNGFGYDAKSDKYVDLFESGIIDPKKVTRVALENAASVAGMILTTECALVDIKEDSPSPPPMGGGGMPGMM